MFKKPLFFQRFLMKIDAGKYTERTSWTSFEDFGVPKIDIDFRYVFFGTLWASYSLVWAVTGRPGGSLGGHLGAHEATLRVSRASLGRHFFIKMESYFAYPILDLILDAPAPLWGAILAPKAPPDAPKWCCFCVNININISINISID